MVDELLYAYDLVLMSETMEDLKATQIGLPFIQDFFSI